MKEFIKDFIYALFDSSQTVLLIAAGFVTLFYTTRASDSSGLKLKLRRIGTVLLPIYFLLLLVYLVYRTLDTKCDTKMNKIADIRRSANAMLSRDSSRITSIRSKIELNVGGNPDSLYELRHMITSINYGRIRRLENFKVYLSEHCTSCLDYEDAKQKFDSIKTVMSHEK